MLKIIFIQNIVSNVYDKNIKQYKLFLKFYYSDLQLSLKN